jgi:hypothetical protein
VQLCDKSGGFSFLTKQPEVNFQKNQFNKSMCYTTQLLNSMLKLHVAVEPRHVLALLEYFKILGIHPLGENENLNFYI